jgi:hypothetical protein
VTGYSSLGDNTQFRHAMAAAVERIACILENPLYFLLPSIMQESSRIGKNLEPDKFYPKKHSFPYSTGSNNKRNIKLVLPDHCMLRSPVPICCIIPEWCTPRVNYMIKLSALERQGK